eukprot:COSAG01_NODE_6166_length_3814_cov_46.365276_2_plen_33_part_00
MFSAVPVGFSRVPPAALHAWYVTEGWSSPSAK